MKNFFYSKNMLVLLHLITITPIYFYFLIIDPLGYGSDPIYIMIYLIVALLIVYFIYILTAVVELIIMKITRLVELEYIIIFPFAFDGSWRFVPIKLIASQLYLRGSMVINLANDFKKGANENKLKGKLKTIFNQRLISTAIVYLVIMFVFSLQFNLFIIPTLLISGLAEIILAYTTDHRQIYGTGYLLKNGNIDRYLYTLPNLKTFTAENYADYLDKTAGVSSRLEDYKDVQIFENEIYACIYEQKQPMNIDRLKFYCELILLTTYTATFSTFTHEYRKNGLRKSIGLYALSMNEPHILQLIKGILEQDIAAVSGTVSARHTESFLYYLMGEKVTIKPIQHFVLGLDDYFSHRNQIEQRIIEIALEHQSKK